MRIEGGFVFQEFKNIIQGLELPIVIIITVYCLKLLVTTAKRNWTYILRQGIVSLLVGLLANNYFLGRGDLSEGFVLVLVAFFAFEADNLIRGINTLGKRMRDDPIQLAKDIRDIIRGK